MPTKNGVKAASECQTVDVDRDSLVQTLYAVILLFTVAHRIKKAELLPPRN